MDWLRESAVHVAELLRVASVHEALTKFQSWKYINTEGEDGGGNREHVVELQPSTHFVPGASGSESGKTADTATPPQD